MTKLTNLSRRLLTLRKAQKMTQGVLAQKVGVSTNAISQFEKGGIRPSLETLAKLSIVFGEDLSLLSPRVGAVPVRSIEDNIVVPIIHGRIYNYLLGDLQGLPDATTETASSLGAENSYEALTLPPSMLTSGIHRVFTMPGNDMSPTFERGDLLLFRLLDPAEWNNIGTKSDEDKLIFRFSLYAIHWGTASSQTIEYGRLSFNSPKRTMTCQSDDLTRNHQIPLKEILGIWKFEWLLSRRSPNLAGEMNDMKNELQQALLKVKQLESRFNPTEAEA